ncbi:hypothetical protein DVH24_032720 [Malus domestica]|uniref:Uncharacterized protein n=1 Tax=Malus domestica TaxID=3750 RepID=A0A498J968_MALDO|nr:hypothetical protein DVH24_032720 [Malus domestica]
MGLPLFIYPPAFLFLSARDSPRLLDLIPADCRRIGPLRYLETTSLTLRRYVKLEGLSKVLCVCVCIYRNFASIANRTSSLPPIVFPSARIIIYDQCDPISLFFNCNCGLIYKFCVNLPPIVSSHIKTLSRRKSVNCEGKKCNREETI